MPMRHRTNFKTKLMLLALATSGLGILLVTLATVFVQTTGYREEVQRRIAGYAEVIGTTSAAALLFNNAGEAAKQLASMKSNPGVLEGALYLPDGTRLATYVQDGKTAAAPPERAPSPGARFLGDQLMLTSTIVFDDQNAGSIYVRYSMAEDYERLTGNVLISAGAGGVALAVAFLLAMSLQRSLARPLLELERTVSEVAAKKDYSLRAVKMNDDELGRLTDHINAMLHGIQIRDLALEEHRAHLERRVEERTQELSQANANLQAANEQLRGANEESKRLAKLAESANKAKSVFLANMSHEIRTPATAIVGYIDIMKRRPDRSPEQAAAWFDRIQNNAEHLVMLINDLLDLSKIESGQINVFVEPCELFNILRQVDATMGNLAEQKGVRFEIAHDSALPRRIETDPLRLKQILINLINNAIKFTDAEGTVGLEIGYEDAADRGRLRCAVTDTGVGIAPEQLSAIFEPFMQAHADGKRQYGGVGLGLNISRRLARLLGGDIRVNSRPGVGSTFTLEIDAGPADAIELIDIAEAVATVNDETAPASDGGLDLSDVRVLIAEDNPDNQKIITLLLEDTGARIDLASNGLQALERFFEAARRDDPYDVVFMDMQMPEMDGYAATRELRARGVETPVIAMTAYALDEDRDRCLAAGCDTHVAKPIAPESMYEAVLRLVPKARRRQDEAAPASAGRGASTAQTGTSVVSSLAGVPGFEALLSEYVEAATGMAQELRGLWERGEVEPARQLIHKIRGSAGSYGFGPVSEAAAACEIRILAGDDPAEVAPQVEHLLHLLERVAAAPRP